MQLAPLPVSSIRRHWSEVQRLPFILAVVGLLTIVFLIGHVPLIPQTRDGIDSTNFVLAVDRYDPGLHQPHPPGFPVHVAFGRLITLAYRAVEPDASDIGTAAASLRIWSVFCGALVVGTIMWLAMGLGLSAPRAMLVSALATTCPLFWVTAMRPLSDVPGLLFALVAQASALTAFRRSLPIGAVDSPAARSLPSAEYRWVLAAFVTGLAIGVRVQTALLTLPLLAATTWLYARSAGTAVVSRVVGGLALGLLAWAIPLLWAIGGPAEYVRLLTTVAADDVQGVEMLSTHLGPRLLAAALERTFIVPWGLAPLGWMAFVLSVMGAIALARQDRRRLGFALLMGMPYLLFHLLFQETGSIRYALPLVPVSCLLIVSNLKWRPVRLLAALAVFMIVVSATVSSGAAAAYGRTESPVARALEDLTRTLASRSDRPTLAFHHSVFRATRGEDWPGPVLSAPVRYEWLELANYWLSGHRDSVWFLADGRRTDLALIDPAATNLTRSYRWPASTEALLGGATPTNVAWYEIAPPGWFLMGGWALTPETRGVATRDNAGPGIDGIVGYIRRRDGPAVLMIGGRNLGGPCDTAAAIDVTIDGRVRASWTTVSRSTFLQTIPLAAGDLRGLGDYSAVKLTARDAAPEGRLVDVAVEQFDVQSPGRAMRGFDRGWHMQELDLASGRMWRWTDETATLRVETFGRDVELVIRGESPLRYFQQSPDVVVRAGQAQIASFRPRADFQWVVDLPATVLAASDGQVTIQTDKSFVPDQVTRNGDQRRLGLRLFSVEVRPRTKGSE